MSPQPASSFVEEQALLTERTQESFGATLALPSAPGGVRFKAVFIRAGESLNGNRYDAATLIEAAPLFRAGLKMYLDHGSTPRSVRDLAGVVTTSAKFEDNALVGEVDILDPALREKALRCPAAVGLSINAIGRVERSAGQRQVRHIREVKSIDFVAEPAAGGGLTSLTTASTSSTPVLKEALSVQETRLREVQEPETPATSTAPVSLKEVLEENLRLKETLETLRCEQTRQERDRWIQEAAGAHTLPAAVRQRIEEKLGPTAQEAETQALVTAELTYLKEASSQLFGATAKTSATPRPHPASTLRPAATTISHPLQQAFDALHHL